MLEAVLGIFTSGGFGVVTGLVGAWVAKREERKLAELRFVHVEKMADIDATILVSEQNHALAVADKNIEQAQVEGAIAADIAESQLVKATVEAQAKPSGNAIIDGILRFVRPMITLYLLLITTFVTSKIHSLVGGLEALPVSQLFELYVYIIEALVFLTITAVSWWFGSRGKKLELGK